jgi:hypothetical protein
LLGALRPRWLTKGDLNAYEIDDAREALKHQVLDIETNAQTLLSESTHQVAYRFQGLGRSMYAPLHNIDSLTQSTLSDFYHANYIPQNTVIVASGGISHEQVVDLVSKHQLVDHCVNPTPFHASRYYGGELLRPASGPTHVAIAFKVCVCVCDRSQTKMTMTLSYLFRVPVCLTKNGLL